MASFASSNKPFFFLIDFEMEKPQLYSPEEAFDLGFKFEINGVSNFTRKKVSQQTTPFSIIPVSKYRYAKAFKKVYNGNSFLLNLTFPSRIESAVSLENLFHLAHGSYKLLQKDNLLIYSPECFIKIKGDWIYTFPMKGTFSGDLTEVKKKLKTDVKELYEHNTIVDLMRNDLSRFAKNVQVSRFRYLKKIKTQKKEFYQTCSEIKGKLNRDWKSSLPEILFSMLPAGSISGAPKEKTVSIIKSVEKNIRGYYCGVFGYFDGKNLDTAVNIRCLQKHENQLFYHSGGGITHLSEIDSEYDELIRKIYVPVI